MKKPFKIILSIAWFLFISFLFFLPGSAIPNNDWFSRVHFDKFVHVGFFAVLVFLWTWSLNLYTKKEIIVLLLSALIYGFAIEICQDKFVANRSFDPGDVAADFIGSIIGSLVGYKKIDPCGNRGRNQN